MLECFIFFFTHRYQIMNDNRDQRRNQIIKLLAFKRINNKYIVGGFFDSGSYAIIFFASNQHGDALAIKAVDLSIIQTEQDPAKKQKLRRRLEQEDEAMKACDSPYVMKCIDSFIDRENKLKLLVMDYCTFGSLKDIIDIRGYIPEFEAKIILKQILFGLAEVHGKGGLHRDLKKENICAQINRFMICDFGCAATCVSEEGQEGFNWRKTNNIRTTYLGSPCSKAPEMLKEQEYGPRVDLYAIGVIFYEMITGVHPFMISEEQSSQAILKHIQDNMSQIFDPTYIKQNWKKCYCSEEIEGNANVSHKARDFIKDLIVIDPKKRAGWQNLLQSPYLNESSVMKNVQISQCLLPLESIKWKEVQQILDRGMKKVYFARKKGDYICESREYEIESMKMVKEYSKISLEEIESLKKIKKKQNESLEKVLKRLKIINFEVQRIKLLFEVYEELNQFKIKRSFKVGRIISIYCFLKSQQVEQYIKNSYGVSSTIYEHDSIMKLSKQIHESDSKFMAEHESGVYFKIHEILEYSQEKRIFYEFMAKQNPTWQELKENYPIFQTNCKKAMEQLGMSQMSDNLCVFLKHPKEVLQCQFECDEEEVWRKWDCLREYI